ncbi:glycoside hydrolase family 10 protein [Leifsonia aquatica]|uniref:glycoside hydrolase family 10 protein n=1 Tax=Leifsonia aquatica TaxID=144185 RepID=UPI00380FF879
MSATWKFVSLRRAVALAIAVAAAGAGVLGAGPAGAAPATEPLSKWVKTADGYAYDPAQPVMLYPQSAEQVQIPTTYTQPERQFRSSWVATVNQLNVAKPASEADFQAQYTRILDRFEEAKLNAMIFQVRPAQDAWYPSALNPWSQFLSGTQGVDPGYDPLEWMVQQTHARGMEYHAWFNPYRVTTSAITSAPVLAALGMTADEARALTAEQAVRALAGAGLLAADNYAVQHPEHVLLFNGTLFLDPGEPAVRQHVIDSVREVATNYDVDGIHFDDYFYPYRTTAYFGDAGEDRSTFEQYGLTAGYADTADGIAQWRRDNVTALVSGVHDALARLNAERGTAVQFGVSPFGIWEHESVDPRGSHTPATSSSTYSKAVFADTRAWVKEELVDYIVPQIYWSFDQAAAPYGELARWWSDTVTGTDVRLYIGHADYKHLQSSATEAAWANPDEVPNQLLFDQTLPGVTGEVFYGYNDIVPGSTAGLTGAALTAMEAKNASLDRIFGDLLTDPVLPPADPRKAAPALRAPVATGGDAAAGSLTWTDGSPGTTRAFAVYLDGRLHSVTYADGSPSYTVATAAASTARASGVVSVAALDRAMNSTAQVALAPVEPVDPVDPVDPSGPGQPGAVPAGSDAAALSTSRLADTGSTTSATWLLAAGLLGVGGVLATFTRRARTPRPGRPGPR